MFDDIPVRFWLLALLAAWAIDPTRYAWSHFRHSPAHLDVTKPRPDLSWRTSRRLIANVLLLIALSGTAVFIFTPSAERIARSSHFLPFLLACFGASALFTILNAFRTGRIQPLSRGAIGPFYLTTQPKRFWASVGWNALIGLSIVGFGYLAVKDASAIALRDACYDDGDRSSPKQSVSACNSLLAETQDADETADLLGARGAAFHRLGEYQRALRDYDDAIRKNPRDSYTHLNRARIHEVLGDERRSIDDYTTALRLRPNYADAWLGRGVLMLNQGELEAAIADLTRAHSLDPKNPWALANRGMAYALQQDQQRAEQDLRVVRSSDPDNPVMMRARAFLQINDGDYAGALKNLTASLEQEPDNSWTRRMRAYVRQRLEEQEAA